MIVFGVRHEVRKVVVITLDPGWSLSQGRKKELNFGKVPEQVLTPNR